MSSSNTCQCRFTCYTIVIGLYGTVESIHTLQFRRLVSVNMNINKHELLPQK